MKTYTYVLVRFHNTNRCYYYRTGKNYKVSDIVIVPVGKYNQPEEAEIVRIKKYDADSVPYPLNKTKTVIAKFTGWNYFWAVMGYLLNACISAGNQKAESTADDLAWIDEIEEFDAFLDD